MGKLDPRGLALREMKEVLKMLVHDIDHAVAQSPQEEEGADQKKCRKMVTAVGSSK
jgi:hypothetical protein